jgi:hypothetical protein
MYASGERGFLLARDRERNGVLLSVRRISELGKLAEQVRVSPLPPGQR